MANTRYSVLDHFYSIYDTDVHIYMCRAICIVGSVFNIINIIVFTRKNMVSPTNVLLTWLAVADLALLSFYPFTFGNTIPFPGIRQWIREVVKLARFISIWITLGLAVWRYLAVVNPMKARNWCNMKTTYRTVIAVYTLCLLVDLPNIILFQLRHPLQFCEEFSHFIDLWFYCVIPAIAFPILTLGLLHALWKAKKRRQKLMPSFIQQNAEDLERENRTTRMLLIVLFLFLMTMLPHENMLLLRNLLKNKDSGYYFLRFVRLQNFFFMLMLLDAATNFFVYYFMSCQFRKTCYILFSCNAAVTITSLRNKASEEITVETTAV